MISSLSSLKKGSSSTCLPAISPVPVGVYSQKSLKLVDLESKVPLKKSYKEAAVEFHNEFIDPSAINRKASSSLNLINDKGSSSNLLNKKSMDLSISSLDSQQHIAPALKGDCVSISIDKNAYKERMELCQFSLIGRVVLAKGDKPWKLVELKDKLSSIWQLRSWRLISLGRGYYQILLSSADQKNQVWSRGSISLKPGTLRLQAWTPDFNPWRQKTSNVQLWVRIYELSWEYWHKKILTDIASTLGVPLKFDASTINGDFGHYARVLVDVDISKPPPDSMLIERDGIFSTIYFEIENLPSFCSVCSSIGHVASNCRSIKPKDTSKRDDSKTPYGGPVIQSYKPKQAVQDSKAPEVSNIDVSNTEIARDNVDEEIANSAPLQPHAKISPSNSSFQIKEATTDLETCTHSMDGPSSNYPKTSSTALDMKKQAAHDNLSLVARTEGVTEIDDDANWIEVRKRIDKLKGANGSGSKPMSRVSPKRSQ